MGMLFSFVVGLLISGWLLHRLLGSSLTLGGEEVYQSAISTKILLLMAPLLLVMGLVPAMLFTIVRETNFGAMVVLASLRILLTTAVPLLAMIASFVLLNLKGRLGWITEIAFFVGLVFPIVLVFAIDVPGSALGVSVVITSSVIVYFAGVAVAVASFYWCGFRPVWAKRKQVEQAERAVSFDEMI